MRFWFDTEFIDHGKGQRITLLSIGIVGEDGRTFYAETHRAHRVSSLTPWLRENVKPHLDRQYRRDREFIAYHLEQFVGQYPEFWVYCGSYDWVALSQLYGPLIHRPKTWPWVPFDTFQLRDFKRYVVKSDKPHHALSDALALKVSFLAWEKQHGNPTRSH